MRSSKPPRASVTALSLVTRSSTAISLFCRNTWHCGLTDNVRGSRSWSRLLARVCGKSIGTPTVSNGAETMKMMSSTSITSTIGVTLISLITARRRCRRLEFDAAALAVLSPMAASSPFVDLPRQDRGEFVGKPFEALRLFVHLGSELVVENCCRDGGHQTDRGRKQRLRNAGRDYRKRGIFRRRDRLKAGHDPPDRAEQADERPRRADRCQHQKPALEPLDFPRDRHLHDLFDAHLQARKRTHLGFEAALPFAHGGDEQRRHRIRRSLGERAVKLLERLTRPEILFESIHRMTAAIKQHRLVDDDRPHPD